MINKLFYILLLVILFSCNDSVIELNDKWEIYNEQFVKSDNISSPVKEGEYYFTGNPLKSKKNKVFNYGSIKQKIDIKQGVNYSLYLSGIMSSGKVWIDNELLSSYGSLGNNIENSTPWIKRDVVNFIPDSDKIDLVIEFSNFYFKTKYIAKWIVLGETKNVISLYIKHQSKDYFTTGLLIICGTLFLLMFIVNRKEKHNLYFSMFTLSYGIRSYLIKNTTIQEFIPEMTWIMEYQFNKASEIWALTFILLFFRSLFKDEFKSILIRIFAIVALLTSFTAFLPLEIFNRYNLLLLMHLEVLIVGLVIIYKLIICVRNKKKFSLYALISIVLFFGSIVFDIFANRIIISFDYYSAQFVIIVVIAMFLMIGKNRSETTKDLFEKTMLNIDIKNVFSKYVPLQILSNISTNYLKASSPGDYVIKALTIVYIDIRDFTKLSEGLSPIENFQLVNHFYEIAGDEIGKYGGFIESYRGDGVKAIFENDPGDSISAVSEISKKIITIPDLKIGTSIHFGKVVLGKIGCNERIQATAISDVTRIISAMDDFISRMGIEFIITEKVFFSSNISNNRVLYLGDILLKNEEDSIKLYQVFPEDYALDPLFKDTFSSGINMIKNKKYVRALSYFNLANIYQPENKLVLYYITQLELFLNEKGSLFRLRM